MSKHTKMKKYVFIISMIALIAISCKKEKQPEPIAPTPAVEQMYCVTFAHVPENGEPASAYDTVMRMCITGEQAQNMMGLAYPQDYQASWIAQGINEIYVPQPIADCSQCN